MLLRSCSPENCSRYIMTCLLSMILLCSSVPTPYNSVFLFFSDFHPLPLTSFNFHLLPPFFVHISDSYFSTIVWAKYIIIHEQIIYYVIYNVKCHTSVTCLPFFPSSCPFQSFPSSSLFSQKLYCMPIPYSLHFCNKIGTTTLYIPCNSALGLPCGFLFQ